MTTAPSTVHTDSTPSGSVWRGYLPGAAGLAYVAAWVAGLAAWPVNLALTATAGQAAASYRAHPAEAIVQYALVEGLAGALLGIVLASALRAARDDAGRWAAGPAALSAIAVVTSLSQCVIGLCATAAATGGHVAACGSLSDLVNRLDGAKMLALAAAAAWLALTGLALPRWLRGVTAALTVALIASGYAYLTLSNGLAWTAYASGPLLLLWVAGVGIALSRRYRRRSGPGTS
ncbi:MAG TPA: hypothetical protein VHZ33_21255 [Trebonia sp.]|jgi:hypothetical protein|nr:hypothetical protein [Trebonia sp.]